MIFWIITGLAVLFALAAFVNFISEEGIVGFFMGLGVTLLIGMGWLVLNGALFLASSIVPYNQEEVTETVNLRALGSDSSISGRFFLGSGYINGERVLSYIKENENGSFTTGQVGGKYAEIWELENEQPQMVTHTRYSDRWWLFPERVETGTWWEFRVPKGSVSEGFEVTP